MADLKIPRVNDRKLNEVFVYLAEKYNQPMVTINSFGSQLGPINLLETPSGLWGQLLELNDYLISNFTLTIPFFHITYQRGSENGLSPVFDLIRLDVNGQGDNASIAERLDVISFISHELNPYESNNTAGTYAENLKELEAMHHSTLTRLSQVNEEMIGKSAEFRSQLEISFFEKQTELTAQNQRDRIALAEEYAEKVAALATREADVQDTLSKIDNRNNTHARRHIRESMLNDVKTRIENFGVSQNTEKKRKAILWVLSVLIFILTFMVLWHFSELHLLNQKKAFIEASSEAAAKAPITWDIYYLWFRLSVLSALLIGTVIFLVRWMAGWAGRHADTEFYLQQFYLDINRANWLIESCLEWKKETSSEIPDLLLDSITKGLFDNGSPSSREKVRPADELASALFGSASKIKLKSGENEIEVDPKKLGRQTCNADE